MMLLMLRNDYGVDSVCINDRTLAGRGENAQMRVPTATESAVPPYVTYWPQAPQVSSNRRGAAQCSDLCPCLPQRPQRYIAHIGAPGGGDDSSWESTALLPQS